MAVTQYIRSAHHLENGQIQSARQAARQALQTSLGFGDGHQESMSLCLLAMIDYFTAQYEAARDYFRRLQESANNRANVQHTAWATLGLGMCAYRLQDLPKARYLLSKAAGSLIEEQTRFTCQALLAMIHLRMGDQQQAEDALDGALALVDRLPIRIAFSAFEGYAELLNAHLLLAHLRGYTKGSVLANRIAQTRELMLTFTRHHPFARARRDLLLGRAAWIAGRPARAYSLWRRADRRAKAMALPLESRLARHSLERASSGAPDPTTDDAVHPDWITWHEEE